MKVSGPKNVESIVAMTTIFGCERYQKHKKPSIREKDQLNTIDDADKDDDDFMQGARWPSGL